MIMHIGTLPTRYTSNTFVGVHGIAEFPTRVAHLRSPFWRRYRVKFFKRTAFGLLGKQIFIFFQRPLYITLKNENFNQWVFQKIEAPAKTFAAYDHVPLALKISVGSVTGVKNLHKVALCAKVVQFFRSGCGKTGKFEFTN